MLAQNFDVLTELIVAAHAVGADRILIPLLETSAVDTPELKREVVSSLRAAAPVAERHGVTLGLETELPGPEYAKLVQSVGSTRVFAYYDTGKRTAAGVRAGFRGDFVLQHYFEQQPEQEAERALSFVRQLIESAKVEAA